MLKEDYILDLMAYPPQQGEPRRSDVQEVVVCAVPRLMSGIFNESAGLKILVIDLYTPLNNHPDFFAVHIHPNDDSLMLIARTV